jgi:hypothetical protein
MFEPTCTQEGIRKSTCTNCGDIKYTAVSPLGHRDGEWVATTEPTASTMGKAELFCADCHEKIGEAPYSFHTGINTAANSVSQVKASEANTSMRLKVFSENGEELPDNAKVGTGCIIKYVAANNPLRLYKVERVVLYGDINGDGLVNNQDKTIMHNEAFVDGNTVDNDSVYYLAADMNRDTAIDAFDCFMIDGVISGKRPFDQSVFPYN